MKNLAHELVGKIQYVRRAPLEDAPAKMDCLTLVHFLFKKTLGVEIPLTFVGNMPRQLASLEGWKFCCIQPEEASCGDLIFVGRIKEAKLLGHAAIFLSPHEVFHCKRDEGAVIESFEDFSKVFTQKLMDEQLRYIDPNDKLMRQQYNGEKFIPPSKLSQE